MPDFETFKKRMVPLAKSPYVTIQTRGVMSLNAAAHAALGAPEAVELLYDAGAKIIGLRAVSPETEHAYPIRGMGSGKRHEGTSYMVSGTAFTKYYEIPTEVSTRYPAVLDDGILCIDLAKGGTVVTVTRKKPAAPRPSGSPPSES